MSGVSAFPAALLLALASCAPPANQAATPLPPTQIDADIAAARSASPRTPLPAAPQSLPARADAPQAAAAPETAAAGGGPGIAGAAGAGDPATGRRFALDNCRPCHVVAPDQGSPVRFADAPDFRKVANDPRTTPFALNVWLTNPHPTMPSLRLTPEEASNVIAYIISLRQ